MATGDITYKLNGYNLDTGLGAFLTDVTVWRPPVAVRRSPLVIPGVHGTVRGRLPVYDEPQVTIAPKWRVANQAELEERVNQMQALLGQPTLTLSRVSGGVETSAAVELVSITPAEFVVADTATCTILLAVPGVFFRGAVATGTDLAFSANLTNAEPLAALSASTGPIGDAILRVTGPCTNPSISDPNTGTGMYYTGTVPAGQYLYLCARPMVARISTSAAAWLSGGSDVSSLAGFPAAGRLQLWPVVQSSTVRKILLSATGSSRTSATKLAIRGQAAYL